MLFLEAGSDGGAFISSLRKSSSYSVDAAGLDAPCVDKTEFFLQFSIPMLRLRIPVIAEPTRRFGL